MASSALAAGAPLPRQLCDEVLRCDGVLPIMRINLLKDMIGHLQGAPFRAEDGTAGARLGQCGDAPVAAALRPCFHAGYCMRCADDVLARALPCPMCRATVEGVQRIFLP